MSISDKRTVSLPPEQSKYIDSLVAAGTFSTVSEAVRAGLRLLEEQELKIQALRAALIEGEKSGPSQPFDFDRFLDMKHGRKPD
jgi:antitoxin ParD1/3/4